MNVAIYLPLLVPLLAAAAARPLAERLPPRTAAWLLTGSALALAVASSAVLGLLAMAAAFRIPLVDAIGGMSLGVVTRGDPASLPLGVAAAAALTAAALAALRAGWRRAGAMAAAHRQARGLPGSGQVVVVPDEAADAYTVPGWPGRIVITSGMLAALSDDERRVLLAHEQAHAAGCHYLFTAAARLAAAANPLLLPLSRAVDYTTERWADERAAASTGDRHLVAATIGRVALLATAPAPAALGIAGRPVRRVSLAWAGPVPRRVAALLAPPPRPRPLLLVAAAVLVLLAGASALEAARDLHTLLQLARSVG
jgi:Zn-dependent protease with chaperone function